MMLLMLVRKGRGLARGGEGEGGVARAGGGGAGLGPARGGWVAAAAGAWGTRVRWGCEVGVLLGV